MVGTLEKKDATLVGLISWTFEATRRKTGKLRRPEFVTSLLQQLGVIADAEKVRSVHAHLERYIENPNTPQTLPNSIVDKLSRTASNIRTQKPVSPARTDVQKKIVELRERLTKAFSTTAAPPQQNSIANAVTAFLNNPTTSNVDGHVLTALRKIAEGTPPSTPREKRIAEYVTNNGLAERVRIRINWRDLARRARIKRNGEIFVAEQIKRNAAARIENEAKFGQNPPKRFAKKIDELDIPAVKGLPWTHPSRRRKRKPNVR